MELKGATVLITGANRGLGLAFARAALERGAVKVYAAARNPSLITLPGVVPVQLDVNDEESVAAAAQRCGDVTIVVNNAGVATLSGVLGKAGAASLRQHMETNVYGVLRVADHFAPLLAKNGGGALVNVLSVVSFLNSAALSTYSVSKSAAWGLTNALRNELRPQGTQVLGLHVGYIDTDLIKDFDVPKSPPGLIAARTFDALEAGASEVMADETAQAVKASLSSTQPAYLT